MPVSIVDFQKVHAFLSFWDRTNQERSRALAHTATAKRSTVQVGEFAKNVYVL
jgi:predicted HAD superfamily Cof-like phosphohydrolase